MLEELNYEGKWWVPHKPQEIFLGTLTFKPHQHDQQGLLTIIGSLHEIDDEDRFKHKIILGELSNGQKVSLNDCLVISTRPYFTHFERSLIEVQRIFLGCHFLEPEDIVFSSICVTYTNFDKWIKTSDMAGRFFSCRNDKDKEITINYRQAEPIKATVNENCIISIVSKANTSLPSRGLREAYIKEVTCIEIKSLKEKTFDQYIRRLIGVVSNFLNFIIPAEVVVESVAGIREFDKDKKEYHPINHSEEIRIFYGSSISRMVKPNTKSQPLLLFDDIKNSNQFENYMDKWFEIASKLKPVFDLYFGVMYSPEMYKEFQFLGLAQAIESYHRIAMEKESPAKKEREKDIHEIISKFPQKSEWLKWIFQGSYSPHILERAREIFEYYSDIATVYFKFNDKEIFAKKVRDTRNYFSHWFENLDRKAAHDSDLLLLIKDLQMLLQLCMMTQLEFDIDRIKKIFYIDKIRKSINERKFG